MNNDRIDSEIVGVPASEWQGEVMPFVPIEALAVSTPANIYTANVYTSGTNLSDSLNGGFLNPVVQTPIERANAFPKPEIGYDIHWGRWHMTSNGWVKMNISLHFNEKVILRQTFCLRFFDGNLEEHLSILYNDIIQTCKNAIFDANQPPPKYRFWDLIKIDE